MVFLVHGAWGQRAYDNHVSHASQTSEHQHAALQVAIGTDGLMSGCKRPAASPAVARLLARVLDGGSPLDEHDIVALFRARGADFEVHFPAPSVAVTKQSVQGAA